MMSKEIHGFERISGESLKDIALKPFHNVLRDSTTHVLYHYMTIANGCTITPIIDTDGKPVVYKPEE